MKPALKSYRQGVLKFNSGDFKGAIAEFDNELEKHSPYPDLYVYRGRARYIIGDKDGALGDWIKALELGNRKGNELIEKHFS
jgi:tetratricopeptide (TPR) repeat protein